MCELFGNLPQFEYVDFALNHPIFCFDLSAHQEDLFKTGVNINIHIEKTQGDVTGYCLLLEEAKHLIKIEDRRMIRIEKKNTPLKMKPETLVMKIIEAVETDSPTVITFNATTGITKTVLSKKADDAKAAEERRHNLAMEKEARGSGVGEMIGTIKELGKRFGEETKKTVKQGLNKLVDSIDTGEVNVKHKEIFTNKPMLMCICGSSGSGKTHLTFNMLTTPNLLDFDSLYIYTTTPEQSYYQFLKALEYLPKKDVQDLFQYYEENEEEMEIKDIIDIEVKNLTDIKVFFTKNVNDLDLSNIDIKRKNLILFDECVAQRNQAVQQEFFTKGRHHNCHCIYQSQSFTGWILCLLEKMQIVFYYLN
ncbi:hypothetical protein LOTGIDRAFT_155189 [Lottia gigantea]|uniref:Uncharacterized protein n=1 Tax=Lottia gigantea TaxID=225164 RepID=V3Z4S7_LOTGI|nr:hypothetical protein LOTGIDRAFT_155189 [Lottia gigantea]ESO85698.1 hypothetical protein LOTGIDRAFT_155189 [Lottia gigantea]